MANPGLSPEDALQALRANHEHDTQVAAAEALAIPRETFISRLRTARLMFPDWQANEVAAEALPDADLPFEERFRIMRDRNARRLANKSAAEWQKIHIPVEGTYGLCWFGDPHMDDPFCDLTSLEKHAGICRDTEGMFGINGGDSINNWVGRLKALYADQPCTASEGWELVDWLMNDSGVRWAAWILGNHDVWEIGQRIFEKVNVRKIPMHDWEAKLSFVSPGDLHCRAWIRHNFKGNSIWNELHGPKRAAMLSGGVSDIYASFHTHTYAMGQHEIENGKMATLIRARGYKDWDHYAMIHGFPGQQQGQSVVTVIEPGLRPVITTFASVEEGADFLAFKRRKEAA